MSNKLVRKKITEQECGLFLATPFLIGDLRVNNRILSAPMSGVSDVPYQELVKQSGAGLIFSEMAASHLLKEYNKNDVNGAVQLADKFMSSKLSESFTDTSLQAVQIFGRDVEAMKLAAELAQAQGAALIDINMGCPAKKIAQKHSKTGIAQACGAALMRDEDLSLEIIEAVLAAVSVPVSVKMRLGWDDDNLNAPIIAKQAVKAGVQMITVHARTRAQFYEGAADWQKVLKVREAIDQIDDETPLIINGDIYDLTTATKALNQSGADGIMVGRATYGAPWLVGGLSHEKRPSNLKHYILAHYQAMLDYYGEIRGVRHARKHLDWYLQKHASGCFSQEERAELMNMKKSSAAKAILTKILERLDRSC